MFKYVSFITRTDPDTGQPSSPEGKRKVFISYKHSDEEILPLCEKLASHILDKLDVAIWYDHQLTAGEEYDNEIQSAIAQSDAFVLLLTPNILSSKYVLEQEIPLARKNQVAIIPIIAGISEEDIPEIEAYIGRVHMPVWFFGQQKQVQEFQTDPLNQFINGLKISIANKDLIEQAKLFYEKGSHNISLRHLTPEQVFVKAYGYLFGVGSPTDKSVGIKLMESILNMYESDKEFAELQEQVACELTKHLYRVNEPDLFFPYMKYSLAKEYKEAFTLLFNMYRDQWHPEILCNEPDLSLILLEKLYQNNFGKKWDADEIIRESEESELQISSDPVSDTPHIGELVFDEHIAYFQKSITEDRTVDLIIDGCCVATYDVYASFGDIYSLYMAYDPERRILITLYSDFDHYGPETITKGRIYRIDKDRIKAYDFCSDWMKGLRKLPYSPYTFNIK